MIPAFYGLPHCAVTPLEVSIRPVRTEHGERYTVCAKDERGEWRSIFNDAYGAPIKYYHRDFAMAAYRQWRRKADRQGVLVVFVEEIA